MTNNRPFDIDSARGPKWVYSPEVKEHFFNPRNILIDEKSEDMDRFNGYGQFGSPVCGDVMSLWIRVDEQSEKIKECRWKTFGCASAIATTSVLSMMVTEDGGMTLDQALKIKPEQIAERLGGLPARKIHCSILGDKALFAAIDDYLKRTDQEDRIK